MKPLLYKLYGVCVVLTLLTLGLFFYGSHRQVDENNSQYSTIDKTATPQDTGTTTLLVVQEKNNSTEIGEEKNPPTQPAVPVVQKETALVVKKEVKLIAQTPQEHTDVIDTTRSATYKNPCTQTVTYSLGTFDPRFNITQEDFLLVIQRSVAKWNTVGNKTFFTYTPNSGDIKISLVYDERQQRTDESQLQKAEIENSKQSAEALRQEYEALKVTFNEQKETYTNEVNAFTTRQKTYNDTVAMWNEKGGAPQPDYNMLVEERDNLARESTRLQGIYTTLQSLLVTINQKIDRYNELVRYINEKINLINTFANKKFTEGSYSGSKNEITIFQFTDMIKLERVLTHEFGHALGLEHVESEDSIMYYLNTKNTLTLSGEDIQGLKTICNLP